MKSIESCPVSTESQLVVKRTIIEAIKEVMWLNKKPMTLFEIYNKILEQGLYEFKAVDPVHVVGGQIRRHCLGRDFQSSSKTKHFKEVNGNRFYLLTDPPSESIINKKSITAELTDATVKTPVSRRQNREGSHCKVKARLEKQTIVEAIKQVMKAHDRAMTVQEVYESIVQQNLYDFKASQPLHVVRSQIRRHCLELDFPSASDVKHFQMQGENKYYYLSKPIRQKSALGQVGVNTDVEQIAERQTQLRQESSSDKTRDRVFICYSHKDLSHIKRLQVHLKPLEKAGIIQRWDDTQIKPGAKWHEEISAALKRTQVAILFISADFLASDFIMNNELPPLLNAAELEGAMILPVIVSPCRFDKNEALSQYQAINSPNKSLITLDRARRENIFVKIADAVEAALYPD